MGKRDRVKQRKRYMALPFFLFITGLMLLLYPSITAWQYQASVEKQREMFRQQVRKESFVSPEKAEGQESERPFEKLYQELKRRNIKLYEEHQKALVDPWAYEQPGLMLSEYGLEGGAIGFLSIPRMGIELPILLGASQKNMREGAVHLTETSYPIGGENTNCVLAAHRGYRKAPMFREIELLELGDEIHIENFRETLIYRVSEIQVIEPTDMDKLLIREGCDLVTLITCHPYGRSTYRYVVNCERVLVN